MPTKLKTVIPRLVNTPSERPQISLYIADDFREEVRGTVSAVGLHTTRSLTINLAANVAPTIDKPVAIHSLSFLIALKGFLGEKKLSFSFAISSRPGELISTHSQLHTFKSPNEGVNMIIRGQPFLFHEFGQRSVVVGVDDYSESIGFEILRGPPPPKNV